MVGPPSCFCFDLCTGWDAQQRLQEFVGITRGVRIHEVHSPWYRYAQAVYAGHAPLPFDLWKVNVWYQNSEHWRFLHPNGRSPIRDCAEHRTWYCGEECEDWRRELRPEPEQVDTVAALIEPTDLILYNQMPHNSIRMVQLFSQHTMQLGRPVFKAHTWAEVIRMDATPRFYEGQIPPACIGDGNEWLWDPRGSWDTVSRNTTNSLFVEETLPQCLQSYASQGGSWWPQGCWMRPVVGSGIWINVGETAFPSDEARNYKRKLPKGGGITQAVVAAHRRGVHTLQYPFGDGIAPTIASSDTSYVPLLVATRDACVAREHGIHSTTWTNILCKTKKARGRSLRRKVDPFPQKC
ncbi:hypothetical protein AB1Y20_010025 [Prymnesium parvum]|uniref:Uncharacterized protein n=1 Tax=Prymnesium parvum TaxID=97485 RepID=A0AB34K2U1_PRYPA